jgi:hypothetical protein
MLSCSTGVRRLIAIIKPPDSARPGVDLCPGHTF